LGVSKEPGSFLKARYLAGNMSSLAEKAAARRAKVLARASKGNSVTAALDDAVGGTAAAALASAAAEDKGTDSPAIVKNQEEKPPSTPSTALSSVNEVETEPDFDRKSQSTPATPATPMDDSDRILAEAEREVFKDVLSPSTPNADDSSAKKTRPLAERRKTIARAKAAAAAAEAAAAVPGPEDDDYVEKQETEKDTEGEANAEGASTPVQFISKTAREVEIEIASMTKRSDAATMGTEVEEDDSDIYKASSTATDASGDQSPVTIGSLRDKMLAKKAARRQSLAAGEGGNAGDGNASPSPKTGAELEERMQKLAQLAAAKTMDASAFPRLIRLVLLITLAAFSGFAAYQGNKTDAVHCLQKRLVLKKEFMHSTKNTSATKRRLGEDINAVVDNNDSDIDQLFDESAAAEVGVSAGWLTKITQSTNDLLVNSAVGPYYTTATGYLHSSNEEFNAALLDSVYRPMFHRRSTDSLTSSDLEAGAQYSLGDVTSSEGCATGWSDTAVVSIFGAWILSTFTTNLIHKPVAAVKKDTSWFATIWNLFTGDFDLVDYLYELVYGLCGELALFWMVSYLVASVLIWMEQAQIAVA